MKCKNCNTMLGDDVSVCPNCGADSRKAAGEKGKLSTGKIALLVVLAVVAVGIVAALIHGSMNGNTDLGDATETTGPDSAETTEATIPADGNADDVTCKGSYSISDEEVADYVDVVVATMGDKTLTNGQLQVSYWMEFYNFMEYYGAYASAVGLDITAPLDTQLSLDSTYTWQQYFLDSAISSWQVYQSLSLAAEEAGFELDAETLDYLGSLEESLEEDAAKNGYENALAMIQADMGAGVTLDDYLNYLYNYYTGYMYYYNVLNNTTFSDAEVEAYFDAHAQEYGEKNLEKDESTYVDVRHILVAVEGGTTGEDGKVVYSDAEWEACRVQAQAILDQWLAGDMTEESFAALANENSEDTGSNTNGGLYEDVTEGEMVTAFNDWCFNSSRKHGDYGLVQTEFGYHIMFFVDSEYIWFATASGDMLTETANALVEGAMEAYPMTVDYNRIGLAVVDFGTEE